ncbi:YMGG-like glycine zipper-containing protein [Thermodesulfobacterium thermophilum]|uniref:YMGG-like glycine zipper-containing protein n=1 Tax=Thermodesulfobacterium thermophilum TaxID=886 RepID=UPI0003B78A10|nr:glycine zipper 2TM domain-containing protein [Thermodesulfobacterium thermophilum]
MKNKLMRCLSFFMVFCLIGYLLTGCVPETSQKTKEGATIGAVAGAVLGALIDKNNRWRGTVIGGVIGGIIGGTAGSIMNKAAAEAATTGKPVEYVSEDQAQKVYATPIGKKDNCEQVKVQYYEYGKLVKEEIKTVCN